MIKFENWEKGFCLYQSELVYYHTFRCAVLLLLGHRLGAFLRNDMVVSKHEADCCILALRAAAHAHPKIARSLESFNQLIKVLDYKSGNLVQTPAQRRSNFTYPHNRSRNSSVIAPDLDHLTKNMSFPASFHAYQTDNQRLASSNIDTNLEGNYEHTPNAQVDPRLAQMVGKIWPATTFGRAVTSAPNSSYQQQPLDLDMHWSPNFSSLDWNVSGDIMHQNINGSLPRSKQ